MIVSKCHSDWAVFLYFPNEISSLVPESTKSRSCNFYSKLSTVCFNNFKLNYTFNYEDKKLFYIRPFHRFFTGPKPYFDWWWQILVKACWFYGSNLLTACTVCIILQWTACTLSGVLLCYMFILCTRDPYYVLYMALLIFKCSEEIHYVPIGDGDMWYYVPVDDGWGRNVYITTQYFSPNAKYWTASSGNPGTRAPPDRMWTLYHLALESVHNMGVLTFQYFSPNAKYWTASSGNRTRAPPDRMWTLYHWAMEFVHNMGVLTSQYFSPNGKY